MVGYDLNIVLMDKMWSNIKIKVKWFLQKCVLVVKL